MNDISCVAQLCPTLYNPTACSPPDSLSMGRSRQEYWSGLHFLLQGMFLTQRPNITGILCHLSHQGTPKGMGVPLKKLFSLQHVEIWLPDQGSNPRPTALGVWRLSHWTTREVLGFLSGVMKMC